MFTQKTIQSESGLFCNIRKRIINDDECDFIEEKRNDPYAIVGDYNFSYPYRLHSCKYCIKRNMRDILEWEIPSEIQEYFPDNNYNAKNMCICGLIMVIAVTILLFDYFIFISLL